MCGFLSPPPPGDGFSLVDEGDLRDALALADVLVDRAETAAHPCCARSRAYTDVTGRVPG